jgi:DNA polymerase (family 10)
MINEEIATIFDNMSRVLSFKGGDRFRIMAYQRAALSLRDLKEDLATTAKEGRLKDIAGVGDDLSAMIEEYIRTKRIRRYEHERKGIPDELIDLMSIPGLGPKTLGALHKKLHVTSFEDLKRAIDSGELRKLPGFRAKKAENLQRGIQLWLSSKQRMTLGVALPLAEELLKDVRNVRGVERADLAGSIRRRRETIGDVDLLIISSDSPTALQKLVKLPQVRQVLGVGDTRATMMIEGGVQVDIRAVPPESYGAALQYFTGSKQHNVHLRTIARKLGFKINEYGVYRGEKRVGGASEDDVYRLLKMQTMPPEMREDRGEIEAAIDRTLPRLIEWRDVRGDLHAHTNYSDGRSTMEEMIEGARRLKYEYIGLADHSPSARVARGLDEKRLEQKIREFEKLKRAHADSQPRVLLGAEVDILSDGKLDYPDDILKRFDVVTASIHAAFRQSKDRITGRLIDAIANPHVHIIGHPTTRLIGSREPVEFDFDRIIRAAAEAHVALEINGSPLRLDLNDTMARGAQEAGVMLAINSDAHSVPQLEYVRYGVYVARRAWVQPQNVVNSWPWTKLQRWLSRERASIGKRSA